jgi:hypothetical protein
MEIREGEKILKVYHHHIFPFVKNVLKVIIGAFPFYMLLFLFQPVLSDSWFYLLNLFIFVLFALVMIYVSLLYWMDRLVITTLRIIHVDWKLLTVRNESEALLNDIQDIQTQERGILSALWIFDYGFFRLETASSHVTIEFRDAPDPEGIRKFIYHIFKQ